jgi:hypothetical protein
VIRNWARRNKVELCFTPTNVSWANPKAHFGSRQFTLANSEHPDHTAQTRALHAYLHWCNASARHSDVLAANAENERASAARGASAGEAALSPEPPPDSDNSQDETP